MASYHHTTLQTLKCSSNTRTSATSAEQRTPRTAAAPWRPIWGEREFGGRMELATDSDECVLKLCYALESILQHGLRTKSIDKLNSALK
ncbi:hypothetical protein PV325_013486 [Microctonus aethiopoides]|nr:hypothetical protein PV325_013486 [Microctonus aethiopoides]